MKELQKKVNSPAALQHKSCPQIEWNHRWSWADRKGPLRLQQITTRWNQNKTANITHLPKWSEMSQKKETVSGILEKRKYLFSKWFEPRSVSSSYSVIVRLSVVLKRTVVGDWCFDNLSGDHLQSQVNSVCQSIEAFIFTAHGSIPDSSYGSVWSSYSCNILTYY